MNASEVFIRRPVATVLLMVGMLLLGMLGYAFLPVSALPAIDFPTLEIVNKRENINDYLVEDFQISGYKCHESIKMELIA